MLRLAITDSKKKKLERIDTVPKRRGTPQQMRWAIPLNSKAYDE